MGGHAGDGPGIRPFSFAVCPFPLSPTPEKTFAEKPIAPVPKITNKQKIWAMTLDMGTGIRFHLVFQFQEKHAPDARRAATDVISRVSCVNSTVTENILEKASIEDW